MNILNENVTALVISGNQLVVGGFAIKGVDLCFESRHAGKSILHTKHHFPMESSWKGYLRATAEQFHKGMWNAGIVSPDIENKELIDPGLRKTVFDALDPTNWYPVTRGAVSRKQQYPGQESAKDVVVIGAGGGYRRGEIPVISAKTNQGQSRVLIDAVVASRRFNKGFTTGGVNDIGKSINIPPEAINMRYNDYIGRTNSPLGRGLMTSRPPGSFPDYLNSAPKEGWLEELYARTSKRFVRPLE